MNQQRRITLAVAFACASMAAGQATAIEVADKNGWKVDINGTINAFYVNSTQETTSPAGVTTSNDQVNVQNGLLPGWINFVVITKQEGLDIKGHFGFAPGINNNSNAVVGLPLQPGSPVAAGGTTYPNTDTRNIYFSFGNASMGTIKMGRDIGLFAQTPILNDMTLLGVGGTPRAAEPYNTSFGMIGHGYMYTGFQPQITYSTPNLGGFNASVGLFNPVAVDQNNANATPVERKSTGYQGLATFDWAGPFNGKLWASAVNNKTSGADGYTAEGFEGGVKVGFGPVDLLASAFSAKGLGISTIGAQFLGGWNTLTNQRLESEGIFTQATVKATSKLKVGVSYGKNTDTDLIAVGTETTNEATAGGVYYSLTPSITLVGEYVAEKLKNGAAVGDSTKTDTVSLGAIFFF